MKVNNNTMQYGRGKYARLCVVVNLSKMLLAIFNIKGRKYKIEYEGLHLLCLYVEGIDITRKGVQQLLEGMVWLEKRYI